MMKLKGRELPKLWKGNTNFDVELSDALSVTSNRVASGILSHHNYEWRKLI